MISETLTALSGDIHNAYIAIGNKGGTYSTTGSKDLSAAIDTIPQGSSSPVIPYMIEKLGMPDIREILANEPRVQSYAHKAIVLFWDNPTYNVHIRGANYYIGSDGYERTSTTKNYVETHTFTPIAGTHYFWLIYATNDNEQFTFQWATNSGTTVDYAWNSNTQSSPLWIYGPEEYVAQKSQMWRQRPIVDCDIRLKFTGNSYLSYLACNTACKQPTYDVSEFNSTLYHANDYCTMKLDFIGTPRWSTGFGNVYGLTEAPPNLNLSGITSIASFFLNDVSMRKGPKTVVNSGKLTSMNQTFMYCYTMNELEAQWDTSKVTNFTNAFGYCACLDADLDWLDTSSATNTTNMFLNCYNLKKAPSNLDLSKVTAATGMFSGCYGIHFEQQSYDLSSCTLANQMFYYCRAEVKFPDLTNTQTIRNMNSMYGYCYSMRTPPSIASTENVTDFANMFYSCYELQYAPENIDFSKATTVANMFYQCVNMRRIPDVMNLSAITVSSGVTNFLYQCGKVMNLPTHLTMPNVTGVNLSFANLDKVHPDTLATFDENGNINGGMVYNLNTVTNTVTITLNATLAGRFTPAHRTAITTMLQNKGYTVASFTSSKTDGRF